MFLFQAHTLSHLWTLWAAHTFPLLGNPFLVCEESTRRITLDAPAYVSKPRLQKQIYDVLWWLYIPQEQVSYICICLFMTLPQFSWFGHFWPNFLSFDAMETCPLFPQDIVWPSFHGFTTETCGILSFSLVLREGKVFTPIDDSFEALERNTIYMYWKFVKLHIKYRKLTYTPSFSKKEPLSKKLVMLYNSLNKCKFSEIINTFNLG